MANVKYKRGTLTLQFYIAFVSGLPFDSGKPADSMYSFVSEFELWEVILTRTLITTWNASTVPGLIVFLQMNI